MSEKEYSYHFQEVLNSSEKHRSEYEAIIDLIDHENLKQLEAISSYLKVYDLSKKIAEVIRLFRHLNSNAPKIFEKLKGILTNLDQMETEVPRFQENRSVLARSYQPELRIKQLRRDIENIIRSQGFSVEEMRGYYKNQFRIAQLGVNAPREKGASVPGANLLEKLFTAEAQIEESRQDPNKNVDQQYLEQLISDGILVYSVSKEKWLKVDALTPSQDFTVVLYTDENGNKKRQDLTSKELIYQLHPKDQTVDINVLKERYHKGHDTGVFEQVIAEKKLGFALSRRGQCEYGDPKSRTIETIISFNELINRGREIPINRWIVRYSHGQILKPIQINSGLLKFSSHFEDWKKEYGHR